MPAAAPRELTFGSLLQALGTGAVAVAVLVAAAAVTGMLPAGHEAHVAAGACLAVLANAGAIVLHGKLARRAPATAFERDPRLMAGRVQSLLAGAFVVKLAVLIAAVLVLRQSGAKFDTLASVCIAFASASVVCQVASAGVLSRMLRRGPREAQAAAAALDQTTVGQTDARAADASWTEPRRADPRRPES